MVRPATPLTNSALDQIQARASREDNVRQQPAGDHDNGWFLPGNESSLRRINTHFNSDLLGASPEAIANQVLSHIGV